MTPSYSTPSDYSLWTIREMQRANESSSRMWWSWGKLCVIGSLVPRSSLPAGRAWHPKEAKLRCNKTLRRKTPSQTIGHLPTLRPKAKQAAAAGTGLHAGMEIQSDFPGHLPGMHSGQPGTRFEIWIGGRSCEGADVVRGARHHPRTPARWGGHGVTWNSHICLHFITEMVKFDFSVTLQFTSSRKKKKKEKKSNRKQLKSKQELNQAVTSWYRMN